MGSSGYPTGLDAFATTHQDNVGEVIHAPNVNELADAVNKLEAVLGRLPADVFADVATRLMDVEMPVTNVRTGSYTLAAGDRTKVIEMNVAGANTLTVPPNSAVAFPVGTLIEVFQYGAGQTTITAGAGVTIRSAGGRMRLTTQYSSCALRKRATDEWVLVGDLTT